MKCPKCGYTDEQPAVSFIIAVGDHDVPVKGYTYPTKMSFQLFYNSSAVLDKAVQSIVNNELLKNFDKDVTISGDYARVDIFLK